VEEKKGATRSLYTIVSKTIDDHKLKRFEKFGGTERGCGIYPHPMVFYCKPWEIDHKKMRVDRLPSISATCRGRYASYIERKILENQKIQKSR
jgi:hypothetical protein